jgi:hypothetical protein
MIFDRFRIKEVKIPLYSDEGEFEVAKKTKNSFPRKSFIKNKFAFWTLFLVLFVILIYVITKFFQIVGLISLAIIFIPIFSSANWLSFLKKERFINLILLFGLFSIILFMGSYSNINLNFLALSRDVPYLFSTLVLASTNPNSANPRFNQVLYFGSFLTIWLVILYLILSFIFLLSKFWVFFGATKLRYSLIQKFLICLPFLLVLIIFITKTILGTKSLEILSQTQTYFFLSILYLYQILISFIILPKIKEVDKNLLKLGGLKNHQNPLLEGYSLRKRKPPHIYE